MAIGSILSVDFLKTKYIMFGGPFDHRKYFSNIVKYESNDIHPFVFIKSVICNLSISLYNDIFCELLKVFT